APAPALDPARIGPVGRGARRGAGGGERGRRLGVARPGRRAGDVLDRPRGADPSGGVGEWRAEDDVCHKAKVAAAVVLMVGTLLAAGAWARQGRAEPPASEPERAAAAAEVRKQPRDEVKEPKKPEGTKMIIGGRVLDPAGKPLAGAQVAVCGQQGL